MLFDQGISAKGKTIVEQMMNLDLKRAYEQSIRDARNHVPITVDLLKNYARLTMQNTGSTYKTALGEFSSANGDLRLVNVTAGIGGRSYLSYTKVPSRLQEFCDWLNAERARAGKMNTQELYELSFDVHYKLVTIHPWADGNGRMSRLLMNHIQFEFGLVPSKVLKEDKGDYINALIVSREDENLQIFRDFMAGEMVKTVSTDIDAFLKSSEEEVPVFEEKPSGKIKTKDRIVLLLKSNPRHTTSTLAEATGVSAKAIEKHLSNLRKEGTITREGPAHGGYWKVLK